MRVAVVRPLIARRRDRDCRTRIQHRQFTVNRADRVVACISTGELIALHHVRHRTLARQCDAACNDRIDRIRSDQAIHIVLRPGLFHSGISKFLVLRCDCKLNRRDRQFSGHCRDRIILRDICRAVHDLVTCCYRVIAVCCIRYVRDTAGRLRDQFVAFKQAAFCQLNKCILMRTAVVRPLIARRRDRDRRTRIQHRQFTVNRADRVVACISTGELIALHHVRHRTLARERDAACHDCRYGICSNQACHIIFRPAVRRSIIRKFLVLRRNCQLNRCDRQRSGHGRDRIVLRDIRRAVHDLVTCCHRVVSVCRIRHVRDTACRFCDQLVAFKQTAASQLNQCVLMRVAVVRPLIARRRDRDRLAGFLHRQLAVFRRNGVIASRTGRECIALHHVVHRALARQCDTAGHDCRYGICSNQA